MSLSKNRQRSYSAEELEQHTGFDRRTVAYYVQEGLLPRVGRRGPRTRYPALVRDRLLFIQRVREAEELGEIEPLTLSDLRQLFEKLTPSIIFEVADQMAPVRLAVAALARTEDSTAAHRSASARHTAREEAWRAMESVADYEIGRPDRSVQSSVAPGTAEASVRMPEQEDEDLDYAAEDAPDDETLLQAPEARWGGEDVYGPELAELLSEIDYHARQERQSPDAVENWSRVKLTPDIELSVRGLRGKEKSLLEAAASRFRRLIGR